jgi:hypothetical protein
MPRRPKKPESKPVEVEELKDAILQAIVDKFGDRPLSWETVEEALREVNIEAKMAHLRGVAEPWRPLARPA